jgi:uncharacterized protein YecT (DUF1311 family)
MKSLIGALLGAWMLGVLAPPPAMAEPSKEQAAVLEQCLVDAKDEKIACLGRLQKPCLEEPGGETTGGMVECSRDERELWAARADTASAAIAARLAPARLKLFNAAEKAWRDYRDASCAYDSSIYDGGSLERVIVADCLLRETALRAIDLEDDLNNPLENQ